MCFRSDGVEGARVSSRPTGSICTLLRVYPLHDFISLRRISAMSPSFILCRSSSLPQRFFAEYSSLQKRLFTTWHMALCPGRRLDGCLLYRKVRSISQTAISPPRGPFTHPTAPSLARTNDHLPHTLMATDPQPLRRRLRLLLLSLDPPADPDHIPSPLPRVVGPER